MFNAARMMGVVIGIMVGLVIALVLIRSINKNKKLVTEYDEMQKQIRGVGYKYAFYTVVIYEAVMCVLTMGMEVPAEQFVIHYAGIFLGITVHASYCILNDAYVGLNTNIRKFIMVMIVVSVINLAVAFMAWRSGELVVDGRLQAPAVNLMCGLMFAVLGVVGLVKKLTDKEDEA